MQPLTTEAKEITFTISELGRQLGDRQLAWEERSYEHAKLHAFLREWIYRDQTLADLAKPALLGGVAVFVVGLLIAIPKDLARARARRAWATLEGLRNW